MKKSIFFFVLVSLMGVCLFSSLSFENQYPPLIRLHVIANSNSKADQDLKYKVRDEIIIKMKEKTKNSTSLEETRKILQNSIPELEKVALQTVIREGKSDKVEAQLGYFSFPTKYYGDFSLPAGTYEALQLKIGKGEGANWWCVLFPPLCIVNGRSTDFEEAQGRISQAVAGTSQGRRIKIKPAFKVVEMWRETVTY